ncbi:hypothetical protein DO97_11615 [Neosynechococcus sphagnicola sy1]|uniref:HEAT repeat domain-containing protein n=1 Tax=Neosynechococcus sphagnicola sy1 TaxID=1497020 RepID=A0A098TMW6_9CYAN|nr:HEAT repeat domain-containing protein [Neosynechococcus sphagnicola]KGF72193.1 hypothetical protein DO97_11615 [Neosynechococcus sphagnicola sy1]
MTSVIAAIVGFVVGVVLIYWLLQQRTRKQQQAQATQTRKTIEQLENAHEARLRVVTESLRHDYDQQIQPPKPQVEEILPTTTPTSTPTEVDGAANQTAAQPPLDPTLEEPLLPPEPTPVTESLPTALTSEERPSSPEPTPVTESLEPGDATSAPVTLAAQITHWGNTGQVRVIPLLVRYGSHPESAIRTQVATALAQIAEKNRLRTGIPTVLPLLQKLSQDSNPMVRRQAVLTLGFLPSRQVLPLLQRALRDGSGGVVLAARTAIQTLKLKPIAKPAVAQTPVLRLDALKKFKA